MDTYLWMVGFMIYLQVCNAKLDMVYWSLYGHGRKGGKGRGDETRG